MSLDSIQKFVSLPLDVFIERCGEVGGTINRKVEKIIETIWRIQDLFTHIVKNTGEECDSAKLMSQKKEKCSHEIIVLEEAVTKQVLLATQMFSFPQAPCKEPSDFKEKDPETLLLQAFALLCDDLLIKLKLLEKETAKFFSFDGEEELSSITLPLLFEPTSQLPSLKELIMRFKDRPRAIDREDVGTSSMAYEVLSYTDKEHAYDKELLEHMLQQYKNQFKENIGMLAAALGSTGFIEKEEVQKQHKLFVRADFHGCALTFIETLNMLRASGYLENRFHCVPGFFVVFLGDFMDRGHNDIELFSLLLSFKMENPQNVFLVRGNHEDVDMHSLHSKEYYWLICNQEILSDAYQTFPLALFAACEEGRQEKKGRREYVEFVHGFFSFAVDPMGFLGSTDKRSLLNNKQSPFERIMALAGQQSPAKDKNKVAATLFLMGREQEFALQKAQGDARWEEGDVGIPYLWGDVEDQEELLVSSDRGIAAKVSPRGVEALRGIGSEAATVRAVVRGHQHRYHEHKGRKGKVIITTLPVAPIGWGFAPDSVELSIQGLLYTIFPRMKDWGKQPVYYNQQTKTFAISKKIFGFYEELPGVEDI